MNNRKTESEIMQGDQLMQQSPERSITYTPPKQLFKFCETDEQKQDAIVAALTRLAALVNATSEPGKLIAIAEVISDMQPRALQLAFEQLERTHSIACLPSPAEIRHIGDDLHNLEIKQRFRAHLDAQARARNGYLAERVAAGEDQYFGLADFAKVALEKFGIKVGDDKNNRETQPMDDKAWAERKAELQRQKVQLLGNKAQ